MENKLKARLIEAAIMAGRSGQPVKLEVLQGGVRVTILREIKGTIQSTNNYTGWSSIEHAVRNPLLSCVRDLINQMDEFEERER